MKNVFSVFIVIAMSLCIALPAFAAVPHVTLSTNFGDIVIELDDVNAPITVENFLMYVKSGFYDGLIFHRVIEDFMIQGGGFDPNMNKMPVANSIVNEPGISNLRGTIAMAKLGGDPDSATSQFFINHADNLDLNTKNGGFTVFAHVISDMNIVDAIAAIDTGSVSGMQNVPTGPNSPVMIFSATATEEIVGDFDGDYGVDLRDFSLIAADFNTGLPVTTAQINTPGIVSYDLSGGVIAWADSSGDIYGYDINSATAFDIATDANYQDEPSINGDLVLYTSDASGGDGVYAYNIATDTTFTVFDSATQENQPTISGTIAVWRDYRNYHTRVDGTKLKTDIYAADINDPNNITSFQIVSAINGQLYPAIDGNTVVWEDYRNGEYDIYAADISNPNAPSEFIASTMAGSQKRPAISDGLIVWEDHKYDPDISILGYDILEQRNFFVAFGQVLSPDTSSKVIVWQDKRNGNWDIYGYDRTADVEFAIAISDANEISPTIDGGTVVWQVQGDSNRLYHRELCGEYLSADINGDCAIDIDDFAAMTPNWLQRNQ